ncbi:hypothetical protein OG312_11075 [Kocuria rhizophila]|uniref:hypothetical protein n=1 Tax=Kocuria rhizophila TaxID=72000 RepID=UPI002E156122|nr:hypothetical protein OG312_11075 [Kocuria rhizophila]
MSTEKNNKKVEQMFDDGRCLVCVAPGRPGAELEMRDWHGRRVGLCRPHADLVRERAARNGCTEDEALDHIIDTVTEALGIGRSRP